MNKWILIIGTLVVVVVLGMYIRSKAPSPTPTPVITNFDECAAAGNPIMESYPPRCNANGQTFTQDIGTEMEYISEIRVDSPRPNQVVTSPLTVVGAARGSWYFEATFPVTLVDENKTELARGFATAESEWMTEDFVPFTAELIFTPPSTQKGYLLIQNANASGLPENEKILTVPVNFQ